MKKMKKGCTSGFWRANEAAQRVAFGQGHIIPDETGQPLDAILRAEAEAFNGSVIRRRRSGVTVAERCCLDEGFQALQ